MKLLLPLLALAASLQLAPGYYDPAAQRWINRDPRGEQGGLNLHTFVGNDPTGRMDSFGEIAFPTINIPIYFDCPASSGGCFKCVGAFSTAWPFPRNAQAFQTCLTIMLARMTAACLAGNYSSFRLACDNAYSCFAAFWQK